MQKLDIQLRPSKQFLGLMTSLLILTLIVIGTLPWQLGGKCLLMLFTLTYVVFILYRYGFLLSAESIIALQSDANSWHIKDKQQTYAATLSGESTITTLIMILRFIIPGERRQRSCILFKDSVKADEYRQLLVNVRYGKK